MARQAATRGRGGGPPQPRKRDVELAKTEVEMAKVHLSLERVRYIGTAIVGAAWIAATAIPLWAFQGVIEPLSGKETRVEANIVFSFTVAISIAVSVGLAIKVHSQRTELKRQRKRISELEQKVL